MPKRSERMARQARLDRDPPPPTLPSERGERLHRSRDLKMARSAHAYVRGSTQHFYDWLDRHGEVKLPAGPPVWICGDCHVGNIGPVGASTGQPVIELRDLDQTVIGNPAYDLVRLGLSLAMAARSSDLPGVTTAHMTEHLVEGYESAFQGERPSEDPKDLPEPIGLVMRTALRRNWQALREERLDDEPRFPIGRRFWPLTPEEREGVAALVAQESVQRLVMKLDEREDRRELRLLDTAYWVKGCSSLGLWRAAALVEVSVPGKKGKKRRTRSLLDIKEAIETWAPQAHRAKLPGVQAERVVTGACKIAPSLGERMAAATVLDRSVFVRELLPQDLKVELDELTSDEGKRVARYLGTVVGRAHQRQMSPVEATSWLHEMTGYRTRNIDAPLWLWQAVIELVADHEHAYLEHCRRYALDLSRLETQEGTEARRDGRETRGRRDPQGPVVTSAKA